MVPFHSYYILLHFQEYSNVSSYDSFFDNVIKDALFLPNCFFRHL
jgi:hypothetical protein